MPDASNWCMPTMKEKNVTLPENGSRVFQVLGLEYG